MAFQGFPPELFTFYEGLRADNSKTYWQAHKAIYDETVRRPMEELCGELDDEFGPFNVFRPYRDVRFSKDKTPYKDNIAAAGHEAHGNVYYLSLGVEGMYAATGYYMMASDQLDRFRKSVDDERTGTEVADIVARLRKDDYEVGAHGELKTAPRGYPKDHPRIDLLRGKGLTVWRHWGVPRWIHTATAKEKIVEAWRGAAPLNEWLHANVGPSDQPPDERGRR
jgi:uncharacterized protein (TIGR02453 family)